MPNIKQPIKIEIIQKIAEINPGIDLPRLSVKLGNSIVLQPYVRDALLAAIFSHPDQVRLCCDRFGCDGKTRQRLIDTPVGGSGSIYEKMVAIAIGKTPIRVYSAAHIHLDTPLPLQPAPEQCTVWIDLSKITFPRQTLLSQRKGA
jgi:hypothetical protein